jgi:hypothetical protein
MVSKGENPDRLHALGRRRWRAYIITFLEASSFAQFVSGDWWGLFWE